MPAYFLTVAFSGGSVSAVALYEAMTAAVTLVQWLCCNLLLPVVRIYVLLVLAGHVAKEEIDVYKRQESYYYYLEGAEEVPVSELLGKTVTSLEVWGNMEELRFFLSLIHI